MSDVKKAIERVRDKITLFRELDRSYRISNHTLNPCLTATQIALFEEVNKIRLPDDYRLFLGNIGNGGMGPVGGVAKLETDYSYASQALGLPFELNSYWNERPDLANEEDEEYYFRDSLTNGALPLIGLGCGHYLFLVVNGEEHGHIWEDSRCSDGGIYPVKLIKKSIPDKGEMLLNSYINMNGQDRQIYGMWMAEPVEAVYDGYERTTFIEVYEEWLNRAIYLAGALYCNG